MLKTIFAEQKKNKKLFGKSYQNSDYIFTWENVYQSAYITKEFQKVLKKNDFSKMRFHDLRHRCASILYDKGWELKDIQTWFDHADVKPQLMFTPISVMQEKTIWPKIFSILSICKTISTYKFYSLIKFVKTLNLESPNEQNKHAKFSAMMRSFKCLIIYF